MAVEILRLATGRDGGHGALVGLCEVPGRPRQVVPASPAACRDAPGDEEAGQVLRKAEALLKTRYSDARENKIESIRGGSVVAAQLA